MEKGKIRENKKREGEYLLQNMIHKYRIIFIGFIFVMFMNLGTANAAPRYSPGETLDPDCLPTNPDCTVSNPSSAWSTTTSSVSGQLVNYPLNNSDIVTIGSNSTTTAKVWFDPNRQISYFSGSVGIGIVNPTQKLDVVGSINISNGSAYMYNGVKVITASPTLNNYFFGNAGNLTMSGIGGNTAQGFNSLSSNIDGAYNTANGMSSLRLNTSGSNNTAIGVSSLYSNTGGMGNTANGMGSLYSNKNGSYNTAIGVGSLQYNTVGNYNTTSGASSLYSNTEGSNNTSYGVNSMNANTTGNYNTAMGFEALGYNASATSSTAIGYQAGKGVSGMANQNNSLFGYQSGLGLSTGSNNTLLGYSSGSSLTTGSNNILIGYNAVASSIDSVNFLNIGNTIYGNTGTGNVGIGTTSPGTILSLGNTGANTINISTTATSTFGTGIDLRSGCFSVNGVCIGGGSSGLSALAGAALAKGNFLVGNDAGVSQATSTIFLDSNGNVGIGTTTPGTKLDVRGSYSVEKVVNGTFDSDTGWTKGSNWTISSGTASKSSGGNNNLSQTVGVAAGHTYKLTWTLANLSGGNMQVMVGFRTTIIRSANGTYTDYFLAKTTGDLYFIPSASGVIANIDNVSLVELVGGISKSEGGIILDNGVVQSPGNLTINAGGSDLALFSTKGLVIPGSDIAVPLFGGDANAPLQIGMGGSNSDDAEILISRQVNDTKSGNAHAYSDSSTVTRSGTIGYNSFDAFPVYSGTNNFDHYASFQARPRYGSSGLISNIFGFTYNPQINGPVTNAYGTYIYDITGTGTIQNNYGAYFENLTKGVNNYAIYSAGSTKSYFGGNVGIGTTSPFAKLSVAGSAYIGGNLTATGTITTNLLNIIGLRNGILMVRWQWDSWYHHIRYVRFENSQSKFYFQLARQVRYRFPMG